MNKLESMLGFASKAGKLMAGTERVENAIKKHQVQLVICAQDLSPKTLKKFNRLCEANQVDFYCFGTRMELGHWVGVPERGIIGVASSQFAAAIRLLFNDWGDGHK